MKLLETTGAKLVLFSSGSTGEAKAIVHDWERLKQSFTKGNPYRTLAFFPLDHMAGINTFFRTMNSGGCLIIPQRKDPEYICSIIEQFKVELLPTTPTFLNLILISELYKKYDLSSLKIITYGSEPMNEVILKRLIEIFPQVRFKQTYGLSELGVFPTMSKDGTLWIKIGINTRVRDGKLELKTDSAMLGYINAPNPFTSDGWFMTGDRVEQEGEYFKILGRDSDFINVAGYKVNPVEVENEIMKVKNVANCVVYGECNGITGQIVCANVELINPEPDMDIIIRVRTHCIDKLEKFKVPVKIRIETIKTGLKKLR